MSVGKVIVTGGIQRDRAIWMPEFQHYREALLAEVDLGTGAVTPRLRYTTPPDACAEDKPSVVFKCATLRGDRLYLCTQTEVMVLSWPQLTRLRYLSLPTFNDVHHVLPVGDDLLVVSTGLDAVIRVGPRDETLAVTSVVEEDVWARHRQGVDYRRVASTKPHRAHPNFLFELDGVAWVSRCQGRDAIRLGDPRERLPVDVERIHDGEIRGRLAWFTTVDGHLVATDVDARKVHEVWDLPAMTATDQPLGWCRGLCLDGDLAYVGFSRIRPTRLHDNLRWIKHGGRHHGMLPTRIGIYDLRARRHLGDIDLEGVGLAAVFSVIALP